MIHFLKLKKEFFLLGIALFYCANIGIAQNQGRVEHFSFMAYNALDLPDLSIKDLSKEQRKIKIAIIDDGFNLNHELIKPFLLINPLDIPNNHLDDDQNGFIDDSYGWNVSDNEKNISVVEGLEETFFHGTMVASIISTVFLETYDSLAPNYLEFVLIKAVPNNGKSTYIKDGYKGIEYAIKCNVDIICCAWSGGDLSVSQREILNEAESKGITIIGAAGNHYKKVLNPALHKSVIAIAAIDSNKVLNPSSNYGPEIDFVAIGDFVRAGHPINNRAYFYGDGTSAATALFSGAYGIIKCEYPNSSKTQVIEALKFTSKTVNQFNSKNAGDLGSGMPQVTKAMEYLQDPISYSVNFNPFLTEGSFSFYRKSAIQSYTVKPDDSYYGIEFQVDAGSNKNTILEVSSPDTTYLLNLNNSSSSLNQFVLGNTFTIRNKTKKQKDPIQVSYQVISIDSSKMFCKDIKFLYAPIKDLEDGSGEFNYTNGCDCRWVIKAPANKRIRLEVKGMDTQPNVDFLWIFDGSKSLEENLMAKFSGNNLPPTITSSSNEMLLWFLSDETITNKGWTLSYSWVD